MAIEITIGQCQKIIEQRDTQVLNQPHGYFGEIKIAEKRTNTLPECDKHNKQRNCLQQLKLSKPRRMHLHPWNPRKEPNTRITEPIYKELQDVAKHWLSGGEDQKPKDTDQKHANVRLNVSQQSKVDFHTARLGHVIFHITHESAHFNTGGAQAITLRLCGGGKGGGERKADDQK